MITPVRDAEVSEWLYDEGRLVGIENHEAWFDSLTDGEKVTLRNEFAARPVPKPKPATWAFDPAQVRIQRHRFSTTQGEYSLFYRDQLVLRYGDKITLTGHKNSQGQSEWAGYSDEAITDQAHRLYVEGDPYNNVAPLFHRDVLDLLKQGEAVVLSNETFDVLAGEFESNVASIANPCRVGTKDLWLVGTKEALKRIEPLGMATRAMGHLVDTLKSRYPQAGLSFGYIGNDTLRYDDRSWRVFSTTLHPVTGNTFSWGDSRTGDVPAMAELAERDLETWVRRVIGLDPWPAPKPRPAASKGMSP